MVTWLDRMRLNESLVKTDRNLPDDLKKTLLENEVASNSQLHDVKDKANKIYTLQDTELASNQCYALVLSSSINCDSHFTSMSSKTSHRVHETEIGDNNFYQYSFYRVTE